MPSRRTSPLNPEQFHQPQLDLGLEDAPWNPSPQSRWLAEITVQYSHLIKKGPLPDYDDYIEKAMGDFNG